MNTPSIHTSVLANEVLMLLDPQPGSRYIDATLGAAGHANLIADRGANVLGLDQDEAVLSWVKANKLHQNLTLADANFMTIKTQAEKFGFTSCDGILFDLGVSSFQFDTSERGFSFQRNAPLDMRMNRRSGTTAADMVNTLSEDELFELLVNNAQEPQARRIAHEIVERRPITTTLELTEIAESVYNHRRGHLHPATKTFQALRIAVNQELKILKPALDDAFSLLKPGGKLCVISFHEGEDRIVKRTFEAIVKSGMALSLTKKPLVPTREEIDINPRARSAKLRCIQKI